VVNQEAFHRGCSEVMERLLRLEEGEFVPAHRQLEGAAFRWAERWLSGPARHLPGFRHQLIHDASSSRNAGFLRRGTIVSSIDCQSASVFENSGQTTQAGNESRISGTIQERRDLGKRSLKTGPAEGTHFSLGPRTFHTLKFEAKAPGLCTV